MLELESLLLHQPGKEGDRPSIAIDIFRTIAIEQAHMLRHGCRIQSISRDDPPVFQVALREAVTPLRHLIQFKRITPDQQAAAAGSDAIPAQPTPTGGFIILYSMTVHIKLYRVAAAAAGIIGDQRRTVSIISDEALWIHAKGVFGKHWEIG